MNTKSILYNNSGIIKVFLKRGSFIESTHNAHAVICDKKGRKLSKRDGTQGLDLLRSKDINSGRIIGWLASSLGLVPLGSELTSLELLKDLSMREDVFSQL